MRLVALIVLSIGLLQGCATDPANRTCVRAGGEYTRQGCVEYLPDLHEAAYRGNLGVVRSGIASGQDINLNHKDRFGSAAVWAVRGGQVQILDELLRAGAKFIGERPGQSGVRFALQELCGERTVRSRWGPAGLTTFGMQSDRTRIVDLLITFDASAVRNVYIEPCIRHHHDDVARHLIRLGADVNAIQPSFRYSLSTALAVAYLRNEEKLVSDLKGAGAKYASVDLIHSLITIRTDFQKVTIAPGQRRYIRDCLKDGVVLTNAELGDRRIQAYLGALHGLVPEAVAMFLRQKLVNPNEPLIKYSGDTALHVLVGVREFDGERGATFPYAPKAWINMYHFPSDTGASWPESAALTIRTLKLAGADPRVPNRAQKSALELAYQFNADLVPVLEE